jgi:hypothetical protein
MENPFRRLVLCTALILALAVPSQLTAQGRPASASQPVGQISLGGGAPVPIYAFSFGASNTFSGSTGGGAGSGKANLSDVSFVKQADALSTVLFRNTVTGTRLQQVKIDIFGKGAAAAGASIDLQDVVVTAFQVSGGEATESVSLFFERMVFTAGGQSVCWDKGASASC